MSCYWWCMQMPLEIGWAEIFKIKLNICMRRGRTKHPYKQEATCAEFIEKSLIIMWALKLEMTKYISNILKFFSKFPTKFIHIYHIPSLFYWFQNLFDVKLNYVNSEYSKQSSLFSRKKLSEYFSCNIQEKKILYCNFDKRSNIVFFQIKNDKCEVDDIQQRRLWICHPIYVN